MPPMSCTTDQNENPPLAGDDEDVGQERLPLMLCGIIMPEDEARTFGQAGYCRQQGFPHTLIRHQPKPGQRRRVAAVHWPPYSARMIEDAKLRLDAVHAQMAKACKVSGRKMIDVQLIAISKTKPAEEIAWLIEAGHRVFGENKVQEAAAKWPGLRSAHPGIELHLVGQLQSNKSEDAVQLFDVIHSVDRPSLITALGKAQDRLGKKPACFIQVNIGEEAQKGGCAIADIPILLDMAKAAGLSIVGLMAVPPFDVEPAPYFALLGKLARDYGLEGLSMGMSGDFETAIMIGATHIRVGTALFGAR
jgi:PLP dependent protein